MNLGSIAQSIGLGAGQSMIYGAEQQQREANLAATQTDTAFKQMQLMMQQKEMRNREILAGSVSANMQSAGDNLSTTQKMSQVLTKSAAEAETRGDFLGAKTLLEQAKSYESIAKTDAENLQRQQQSQKEDAAKSAINYMEAPSFEGAQAVAQAAVKAGIKPQDIPMPDDPKFVPFVQQLARAPLTSEKVLTMKAAKEEADRKFQERKEEFQTAEKRRLEDSREKAIDRDENRELRREIARGHQALQSQLIEFRRESLRLQAEKQSSGGTKLTAQQSNIISGVTTMVHEGARSLRAISEMAADTRNSPFGDLTGHNVISSLARGGSNVVTPENSQMLAAASSNLGRNVLTAETLGTGRAPTQTQIEDMQKTVAPQVGDTGYTAAYKLATANAIMLNRLETTPKHADPEVQAKRDEDLAYMRKFVTPEAIYKASKADAKSRQQIERSAKSIGDMMLQMGKAADRPQAPATGIDTSNPLLAK